MHTARHIVVSFNCLSSTHICCVLCRTLRIWFLHNDPHIDLQLLNLFVNQLSKLINCDHSLLINHGLLWCVLLYSLNINLFRSWIELVLRLAQILLFLAYHFVIIELEYQHIAGRSLILLDLAKNLEFGGSFPIFVIVVVVLQVLCADLNVA